MIYVDRSVALAELLAEDRMPPDDFWQRDLLVASRLLEYEVWNGINAEDCKPPMATTHRRCWTGSYSWNLRRRFCNAHWNRFQLESGPSTRSTSRPSSSCSGLEKSRS